ncbi:MAG: C39 family peptidase [Deltaproteobacteria bacterium]|nr:C39 family peptidase [Deltaproteobacteria bacterium]
MDVGSEDLLRPRYPRLRKVLIAVCVPLLVAVGIGLPLWLHGLRQQAAAAPSGQPGPLLPQRGAVVYWPVTAGQGSPSEPNLLIGGVPHIRQQPDYCGEACVAMALRRLGHEVTQDEVFARTGVDPSAGRGAYAPELVQALKAYGFAPGKVWYRLDSGAERQGLQDQWQALHDDLKQAIPSIVCMHYRDGPNATQHFRLVLGYEGATDSVLFHEPAEDYGAYRRMSRELFLKLWPLPSRGGHQTVIRMPLALGSLKPAPMTAAWTTGDLQDESEELAATLPEGFHLTVEHPFLVVGDGSAAAVQRRAGGTVRWTVQQLRSLYFARDPDEILQVWLFQGRASYRKNVPRRFDEDPISPYGYYSPRHGALIMNIATGGGTLVHEIVHPYIAANFPASPTWFNEGLASLYEQSGEQGGRIVGGVNWRLPGLQRAILLHSLRSPASLTALSDLAFRGPDSGTNYAQARYLCQYLQARGLLVRYYHAFWANQQSDPTGYETLRQVLEEDDMDAFQAEWERWVMDLSWSS